MIELDVRGLSCPEPVLQLKPLLRTNSEIRVLCSCGASSDNIKRLAQNSGYKVESQKESGVDLEIILKTIH
ncbi:MAG: sulfurtransferase TusA family protein [Helicobacter sp.]|nr:sulfurtransferase TusA family protein [Helicobacter sp.]